MYTPTKLTKRKFSKNKYALCFFGKSTKDEELDLLSL